MRIDPSWFLDPRRLLPLLFGLQFVLWLFCFPTTPEHALGNPKCYDVGALSSAALVFSALMLGTRAAHTMYARKSATSTASTVHEQVFVFNIAVMVFCVSMAALIYLMLPVLITPGAFLSVFEPFGQHRTSTEIHDLSAFGLPTLAESWVLSCAVFSFATFHPCFLGKRRRRIAACCLIVTGVIVLLFSTFAMTRNAFITYALILTCGYVTAHRRPVSPRLAALGLMAFVAFLWLGQTMRTGSILAQEFGGSPFAIEVQQEVWNELNEKYLPGELNTAFLMFTTNADVSRNWLCGTMFQRYSDFQSPDGGYWNTMNALGLWYWQFGYASLLLALLVGWMIGMAHASARAVKYRPGWASTFYALTYPGLAAILRINYFFLSAFVVSALLLLGSRVAYAISSRER